jgi:hypothetical protein
VALYYNLIYRSAPSTDVTPITSAKEKPPSHSSGWGARQTASTAF